MTCQQNPNDEARARSGEKPTLDELIDFLPEEHRHKVIPVVVGNDAAARSAQQ